MTGDWINPRGALADVPEPDPEAIETPRMSRRLVVPCRAQVRASYAAALVKRCPFIDEVDVGRVEVEWSTNGHTFELHALAHWLGRFAGLRLSHEDVTEGIRGALVAAGGGILDVRVVTRWRTADGEAVCVVPR